MLRFPSFTAALASLWLLDSANCAMYTKNSPVLQLDHKSYDNLIAHSNYTSIVEFYAPWCGHCQNLKPAYEKSATSLKGLAKVAAINCDEEANKRFCGSMGVQGFPTLKIIKPGKKPGIPMVEDYQGPRTARDITEAVVSKIKNHVKRLQDADVAGWLKEDNSTAKAILFTDKAAVSALLKAVAIDFLGSIKFAQIRNDQKKQLDYFGVDTKVPKLLLLPGGTKDGVVFEGKLSKDTIIEFLSQVAAPNPDPAPAKLAAKDTKSKGSKPKGAKKNSSKASESSSSSSASSKAKSAAASAAEETLVDSDPLESPGPEVDAEKPVKLPTPEKPRQIETLNDAASLQDQCLTKKSAICFLILLPKQETADAMVAAEAVTALRSLAAYRQKHEQRGAMHAYAAPASNELGKLLRSKPATEVEIIALNAKRGWVKRYAGAALEPVPVEAWVDSVKLGEGKKEKLSSKVEEQIIDMPKGPTGNGERPVTMNIDDLMSGKFNDDSGLKVEMVEELNDEHDEL